MDLDGDVIDPAVAAGDPFFAVLSERERWIEAAVNVRANLRALLSSFRITDVKAHHD